MIEPDGPDNRDQVAPERAIFMLDVSKTSDMEGTPTVHTFRVGPNGTVMGVDMLLVDVIQRLAVHGASLSGVLAHAMGHGLWMRDEQGVVFLATRPTPPSSGIDVGPVRDN